jgi:hypothetical protein
MGGNTVVRREYWRRGWERGVGEMLGLKGFKRGREGIVERGWY